MHFHFMNKETDLEDQGDKETQTQGFWCQFQESDYIPAGFEWTVRLGRENNVALTTSHLNNNNNSNSSWGMLPCVWSFSEVDCPGPAHFLLRPIVPYVYNILKESRAHRRVKWLFLAGWLETSEGTQVGWQAAGALGRERELGGKQGKPHLQPRWKPPGNSELEF